MKKCKRLIAISIWLFSAFRADAFSVERKHLAGIWKLKLDPASSLHQKESTVTIKIQEDGSFHQFEDNDGDDFLEGCWDLEGSQLQLAIGRSSRRADTLLSGKVVAGGDATVAKGQVSAGKFMYPQSHMAFFDQVMAASDTVGKFSLKQSWPLTP